MSVTSTKWLRMVCLDESVVLNGKTGNEMPRSENCLFGETFGGACSNLDWKISPVSLVIQVECKEQPSLLCWVAIPNLVAVCQTVLARGGLVDTYRYLLVAGDPARLGNWSSSTAKCHVRLSYQAWTELNRSKHSVMGYARYSPHLVCSLWQC